MKPQEEMMEEAFQKVLTGNGGKNMRICIVQALDHFSAAEADWFDDPPVIFGIGELIEETETYLKLRNFYVYRKKDGAIKCEKQTEEFQGIVKGGITQRIDLEVDLDAGKFVKQLFPQNEEEIGE